MSQENVEIVKRGYEALNEAYKTGDFLAAIRATVHPDVVLRTSGMFPETGEYRGHEGIREFAANQADAFEDMSLRPEEYIDAGDRVVVPLRFGGKARHTGIPVEFFVVHVSTIRDGKLARLDMYQTKEQALEARRAFGVARLPLSAKGMIPHAKAEVALRLEILRGRCRRRRASRPSRSKANLAVSSLCHW